MTVSPYADEELATGDGEGSEASLNSDEGYERIKVEPDEDSNGPAHFGRGGGGKAQPISSNGAFNGYRDHPHQSSAHSVGSSALGANGLSAASAGGWSSSLPRSELREGEREDSVSVSGRSHSSPRTHSPSRSRSHSEEFDEYRNGDGEGRYGKYKYGGMEEGMEMDYEEGVGVKIGVVKAPHVHMALKEREGEEEEGWVGMDMDVSPLLPSLLPQVRRSDWTLIDVTTLQRNTHRNLELEPEHGLILFSNELSLLWVFGFTATSRPSQSQSRSQPNHSCISGLSLMLLLARLSKHVHKVLQASISTPSSLFASYLLS